ncbi:hypothetical protein M409DRAFT_17386 [Zasmidium cellare ATCC 36951]|uniref:F-box domain-containing protein n=1 Tax=Zasmidium cellare ATCC 36951 TaxID=1080233 RepID=A0A6A6D3A6_ZASCE|nr:uncharacterized protein M409DRAFT_17386 [Zasmidium cellare ATCC 36951]KAF2172146.1 hypothetical protein M409DRAFT_17386 [Zasmidium cellare ATCC 36951]
MTTADRISSLPVELLESILLHVDNNTLLLSQRVNTRFHDTIPGSVRLQEKLFFRQPLHSSGVTISNFRENFNPLLPWETIVTRPLYPIPQPPECLPAEVFGFGMDVGLTDVFVEGTSFGNSIWVIAVDFTGETCWAGLESWRRMFLMRDAVPGLGVLVQWMGRDVKGNLDGGEETEEEATGLLMLDNPEWHRSGTRMATMGKVFDDAKKLAVRKGFVDGDDLVEPHQES